MTCPSPKIAKNAAANPPVDLEISFLMDNIHLIPEENLLTVGFDPIYYPFDDEIQQVKQSNIIHFEVKRKLDTKKERKNGFSSGFEFIGNGRNRRSNRSNRSRMSSVQLDR